MDTDRMPGTDLALYGECLLLHSCILTESMRWSVWNARQRPGAPQ